MKRFKTIIILAVIVIGAASLSAHPWLWKGNGTGTGVCDYMGSVEIPGPLHFHPFDQWEGHNIGYTGFAGTWFDRTTGASGTFSGDFPEVGPSMHRSKGTWTVLRDDGTYVEMGGYTLNCETWDTGYASGYWEVSVQLQDWKGQGTMTGDDPDLPHRDE